MEAIVLAGGRGTRLAHVVPDLPKPMAPIAGKPFLAYLLRSLKIAGFTRVVLSTGYRAAAISSYFGNNFDTLELAYCEETSPLGTGGGIRAAMRIAKEDAVFVVNGDTFVDVDYATMLREHGSDKLAVALIPVPDVARYGAVEVADRRVSAFREKGHSGSGYINAGVYLMQRGLLEDLGLPEVFSFEQDVLMSHLNSLRPAAFAAAGYFIDIGIPEDYARAQIELPRQIRLSCRA